ncbi:MAG TPA: DUF2244 domain-containing protein [Phenylobacterium sp.]|nr:DUF2244 domain-containing protein [Phenylobacterium sp.]
MSEPLYMDAELKPNRSLSPRGFVVLISVVTAVNLGAALMFLQLGAALIPPFLGAGVVALVVAFLASFRAGRLVERVQVTAGQVKVTYETPRARTVVWESPTAFTRVNTVCDDEDRMTAVVLALSAKRRTVAAALSPRERGEFARALEDAIRQARRARSLP